MSSRALILCLAAFLCQASFAKDLSVPRDFPTIQSAIDAASNGDRISIAPGIYKGEGNVDLDFHGKAITVQGAGYLSTAIDCEGRSRGFIFHNNETPSSVLRSLTIRHGKSDEGGAILCQAASPLILRCCFEDCDANAGGAVYIAGGAPSIQATIFQKDHSVTGGGAIYTAGASGTIIGCTFKSNGSNGLGGAVKMANDKSPLTSCVFQENESDFGGGGLAAVASTVKLVNCTLSQNTTFENGGAIDLSSNTTAQLTNCTLAANLSHRGAGGICSEDSSSAAISNSILWSDASSEVLGKASISYSCVSGGASGRGNMNDDPRLADAIGQDLHLTAGSPCIDTASKALLAATQDQDGRTRATGSGPDMGAFEFPITSPQPQITANSTAVFTVPHDGNPNTDTATIIVKGSGYDVLLGTLSFQWTVDNEVVGNSEVLSMTMEVGQQECDLQVRDSNGGIANAKVFVRVLPEPNSAPTANAGMDQSVVATGGAAKVSLHARGYDADGDNLTYCWSNGVSGQDQTLMLMPGSYAYTLTVTDPYGATARSTVHIRVADGIGPIVTLKGSASMSAEVFSRWLDPGATASDETDGNSLPITVYGSVDTTKLGDYELTYVAKDSSGNEGSAKRTVYVVDSTCPVITLKGQNPMTVQCSNGYTEPGATAVDAYDGPLSVKISGSVSSAKGTYTVTYTAKDSSGNKTTATRTVNVIDTSPPVITLNGKNPMTVDLSSGSYSEPGATATDTCDGAVSVSISGSVLNVVGTYAVTYKATDSSGNTAAATRTVNVISSGGPTITNLVANPGSLNSQNQKMKTITLTYTVADPSDPNPAVTVTAVSSDPDSGLFDGDLPGDIVVTDKTHVDLRQEHAPGGQRTYTITVKVTDKNGKTASASVKVVCKMAAQ